MKISSPAQRVLARWIASKRSKDQAPRASYSSRKLSPMVEVVESRQLLCSGPLNPATGFIAGTAFIDSNRDGQLGTDEAYLPGATVLLYKDGQCGPVRQTCTDRFGGYSFEGLTPGTYTVKQLAPCDYKVSGTQILSDLNVASASSGNTIKVTIADPNAVYNNYQGVQPGNYATAQIKINGNDPRANAFGPMTIDLGTTRGADNIAQDITTFCVDDLQSVSFEGGESWKVDPQPGRKITCSAEVGGRIGYLFNHYANSSLTNVTGPALQLAIWELVYDGDAQGTPDFWKGNFELDSPIQTVDGADPDAILDQARQFYLESACKREAVTLLKTSTCATDGQQSMLARGSYNFANTSLYGDINNRFGTSEYWASGEGQKLIKAFDGGDCSTRLGNWLSTSYPNLYGPGNRGCNPLDMTGKSNREVADLVKKYTKANRCSPEVDVLAAALSQYATTKSLGGKVACGYGFRVDDGGVGAVAVNVSCAGDAFKVPNGSYQTVSDLLKTVNGVSRNGQIYGGNYCLAFKVGALFDSLTRMGSVGRCS